MATGIQFGVHEDPTSSIGGRTPAQIKQRFPNAVWGRAFVSGVQNTVVDLRPKVQSAIQPYLDGGLKVIVSFKTNVTDTRNGVWNAKLVELGAYLEQYADQVQVIWWHEPEDDMAGAAFVHAFNKVHDKIKEGGPSVLVGSAAMVYHWAPNWNNTASIMGKTNTPSEWLSYNGVELKADFLAADVYSGRSFALDKTLATHPGYQRWLTQFALALSGNRPIYLTERGFETPSSTDSTNRSALRVTVIEDEFDYLDNCTENIKLYIFWSSPGVENAVGLDLDTAAEDTVIAGMAAAVESSATYEEGYLAGYTAGQAVGYTNGYTAGHTAGVTEGYANGVAAGRAQMRAEIVTYLNGLPPA